MDHTHVSNNRFFLFLQGYGLTLSAAPPLRRGSTPLPIKHQLKREEAVSEDYDWTPGVHEPAHPPVSSSDTTQDTPPPPKPRPQKYHGPLRIVLLGQNGVGKSSLALSLAGLSDRSLSVDSETQASDEGYQRRVTVDDEDSSILVYDNWKQVSINGGPKILSQTPDECVQGTPTLPHSPVLFSFSLFYLFIYLFISEAHSSAMVFDCLYLELSVSLDHRTNELLEAAVRAARGHSLGPGWTEGSPGAGRRESLTSRAKRFLSGLVPRSHHGRDRDRDRDRERDLSRHRASRMLRQKSRSCHDLTALM
uniref:RAS (RAD and GEM)-like GTP binding 2 n=1 Tax=Astyanax mexicanus TaxID=7994 RepID=A0A8B9HBZ0_ASTMX